MIKFRTESADGRKLIGLGLSDKNVEHLKNGRPILVRGAELGVELDIMILHGATEKDMLDELKLGGIKIKTEIHDIDAHKKERKK